MPARNAPRRQPPRGDASTENSDSQINFSINRYDVYLMTVVDTDAPAVMGDIDAYIPGTLFESHERLLHKLV